MTKITIIILFITVIISNCSNILKENDNNFYSSKEIKDSSNVEFKIIIKEQKKIKLKLIMIPPDSGIWIHECLNGETDTINIDSLNFYISIHKSCL